jgi:hypothetical protein
MAVIGFFTGALVVVIIRALQGLTPLWDSGVGLVVCAFTVAGFFVWGIGAFNPNLSVHGDEELEAIAHRKQAEAAERPQGILVSSLWYIAFALLIGLVVIFVFATFPGGLTLTTTNNPEASVAQIGTVAVTLLDQTLQVSQLVILLGFVAIIFISLGIAAAVFAFAFYALHRNVKQVEAEAKLRVSGAAALGSGSAAVAALPGAVEPAAARRSEPFPDLRPGDITPPYPREGGLLAWLVWLIRIPINIVLIFLAPPRNDQSVGAWIRTLVIYFVLMSILFLFFYYVAIGLVLGANNPLLLPITLVNVVLVAYLIMRPKYVLQLTGYIAAVVARFLRWLPRILFQRG